MIFVNIIKTIIDFIIAHPVYASTTFLLAFLDIVIVLEINNKINKKGYTIKKSKSKMRVLTAILTIITMLIPIINLSFTLFLSKQLTDKDEEFINKLINDGIKDGSVIKNKVAEEKEKEFIKDGIKKGSIVEIPKGEDTPALNEEVVPTKAEFTQINPRGPIEVNFEHKEKVKARTAAAGTVRK